MKGEAGAIGQDGAQGAQGAAGVPGAAGAPPMQFGFVDFIDPVDSTGFLGLSGTRVVAAASNAEIAVPRDTTLSGLSVTAGTFTGTVKVVLLVDDIATELACSITTATPECMVQDASVDVEAGSTLVFKYTSTGSTPVKDLRFALGFENTP